MAEEKVSKLNINGQDYIVKDANAVKLSVYEKMIQENLTLIPVDINDVFELPGAAMFSGDYGYCYKIGKLLFVDCVIIGLDFIYDDSQGEAETGIIIKNEYYEKIVRSLAFTGQVFALENDNFKVRTGQLIINTAGQRDGRITIYLPAETNGETIFMLSFSGVIPLTKE